MDTHTQARTATAEAQINDGSNVGREMVAHTGGAPSAGPQTEAQRKKAKLEKVIGELAARAEDYRPLLAAHGIAWDVFVAIIQQAMIKVPRLLDCTTASILQAAMRCAADGLLPDGDEAAITPFKNTAAYVAGYKGLLKCAYAMTDGRGEKVYKDVDVDVVYAGEEGLFEYRKGTDPHLAFSPPLNRDIEAKVVAAYAVVRTNNGGIFIEVTSEKELAKIAAVNKAPGGPRSAWAAQMHMKGPLRRVLKRTPKDQRLARVMQNDEDAYLPNAAAVVDGDATEIPTEALFDDTAHQTGGPAQQTRETAQPDEGQPAPADADEAGADLVAQARGDLMAAQTEAQLQEVIDAIVTHTSSSNRRKKGFFIPAERDGLLANAEALRKAKFGGSEGGGAQLSHAEDLADGQQVAAEIQADAYDDDADAEGLEGISAAQDRLDAATAQAAELSAELHGDGSGEALPPIKDVREALEEHHAEPHPTATASAPSAAPSPASRDSATAASTASPAASSSPGGSAAKSLAGPNVDRQAGALIALADLEKHFALAPQGQRMTPMEAELADPQIGVHFKRGVPMNQTGQIPYFNGADQILGFAKPDRDIAWRDWTPPAVGDAAPLDAAPAAGQPAATAASSPSPSPSATSTPPATTAAPAGGATSASPSDDGYGEAPFAFQLMYDPKQPPREYADAAVWRDALLFKMSALRKEVGPLWWRDNKGFVEAAIPHAKPHCGKIITVAVSKGWPGAAELVDQYGPFN